MSDVLNNDQGAIVANGGVDLDSQNGLDNQGGQLNLGTINIKGIALIMTKVSLLLKVPISKPQVLLTNKASLLPIVPSIFKLSLLTIKTEKSSQLDSLI